MGEWLGAAGIVVGLVLLYAACAAFSASLPAPFNRHRRHRRRR